MQRAASAADDTLEIVLGAFVLVRIVSDKALDVMPRARAAVEKRCHLLRCQSGQGRQRPR